VQRVAHGAPGQVQQCRWHHRNDFDTAAAASTIIVATAVPAAAAVIVATDTAAPAALASDSSEQQFQTRLDAIGVRRTTVPVGGTAAQVRDGRAHRPLVRAVPQQHGHGVHVSRGRGHHHGRRPVRPHPDVLHSAAVELKSSARRPIHIEPQRRPVVRNGRPEVRPPAADHTRHFAAHHGTLKKLFQRFLAPATTHLSNDDNYYYSNTVLRCNGCVKYKSQIKIKWTGDKQARGVEEKCKYSFSSK